MSKMKTTGFLLTLTTILLAACSGNTTNSGESKASSPSTSNDKPAAAAPANDAKPVEISVWAGNNQIPDETIKRFTEKYPNIKLKLSTFEAQDFKKQLRVTVAAGEIPDIWNTNTGTDFWEYVDRNAAMDITDIVKQNQLDKLADQDFLKANTRDGKIYGLPYSSLYLWQAIFYNKDFFDQNKLPIPKTVDELVDVSNKITKLGKFPLALGIKDGWPEILMLGDYFMQQAGPDYVEKINSGEVKWTDSDVAKNAITAMKKLAAGGALVPGYGTSNQDSAIMAWASGKAVMLYNGTWWPNTTKKTDLGFHIGVMQFPTFQANVQLKGSQYWASNTLAISPKLDGAKKDAAVKFVSFILSDNEMKTKGNLDKAYASNPNVNKDLTLADFWKNDAFTQQISLPKINYFDHAFPVPVVQELQTQIAKVMLDGLDVNQALQKVQDVQAAEIAKTKK